MSVNAIKDLVHRLYSEMLHDPFSAEKFIGPDYIDHNSEQDGRGPDVFRAHLAALRHTFPDLSVKIEDIIVEGDKVVTRVSGSGTHAGTWMDIEATGSVIQLKGINIDRVVDGYIVEHWGEADTVGMLMQMGVDPFAGREPVAASVSDQRQ